MWLRFSACGEEESAAISRLPAKLIHAGTPLHRSRF